MKLKDGIVITIILFFLGVFIGWFIASYYYKKSAEDYQRALIESTIHEIEFNLTDKLYKEYQDTVNYATAGRPFSYLQLGALNELYLNLAVFNDIDSSLFTDLKKNLMAAKINVETFNQQVSYRNNYIFVQSQRVKDFNPLIFGFYYEHVDRSLRSLMQFLADNKESLVR